MKKIIPFILLMLIMTVGCNANNNAADNEYSKVHDRDGTRFISTQRGDGANDNREGIDMLNGTRQGDDVTNETRGRTMSDQNPNLLNTDGGRNDTGKDITQARRVINQTDEFEPGSIWVNGDAMWVTVYQKGKMTNDQRIHAEARVHSLLTKALPRYRIEVRVLEDRR